jgi:Domain of unknown function (DUF4915)
MQGDTSSRTLPLDHAQLLVSIANVAAQPRPSCLLRLDPVSQCAEWVDVGLDEPLASGVGICADERHVYHVCVTNADFGTHLVVLDRTSLRPLNVQPLPEVDDGHSLVRFGDELVVVSTGTDQVLAYPLEGSGVGAPRVLWAPSDSGTDTHHVNSVATADGELLCTAFGPRLDGSWYTARNGYIRNLSTGTVVTEGLRQPHSVTWRNGQLFFCNSLEGTVNTTESVVAYLYGYSRGLAFDTNGTLFVGTSLSRRPPSDVGDVGMFGNPSDHGEVHGQCALVRMSETGVNRVETTMASFGNEIYDIFVL